MKPENDFDESGIRHYWGDAARQLLILAAVIIVAGSPLLANVLGTSLFINVVAVLVIVGFAALTSPRKRWVIMADAVIAGTAFLVFGGWSILSYQTAAFISTAAAVVLALIFLSAFYFSMKTLRAMVLNQVDPTEGTPSVREDDDTGSLQHLPTADDREEEELDEHGGHIPTGDITDEAPKEDFGD